MHKLARRVRFSVNPFLKEQVKGFNSFASKPVGEGLAIFLELCVELAGEVEAKTGFVVNVTEIDRQAREFAVPVFTERIAAEFQAGRHVGLAAMKELLKVVWGKLADKFQKAELNGLSVRLNPYRKIKIDSKDAEMVYFSEKFEFAATHKLWNDDFSEQENFAAFGKCANPTGHGHNYVVEVTVRANASEGLDSGEFERVVDQELIEVVDHKNLNVDVEQFKTAIPTVENIATFAWQRLTGKFKRVELDCVTIWETDRTCCSYYG